MGIIRPREDVSAIDINAFLSRPEGAPPSVGKIADPDKIDVARFLNRYCFGLSARLLSVCKDIFVRIALLFVCAMFC